jgi:hypothetical protein
VEDTQLVEDSGLVVLLVPVEAVKQLLEDPGLIVLLVPVETVKQLLGQHKLQKKAKQPETKPG